MNDSVRQRAYEEALKKLKSRASSAKTYTPEQLELLNNPDICWDIGHDLSAKLGKRNERDS